MDDAKKNSWLSVYTHPKIVAIFFLGIASGIPLALVLSTLSVWLTEEGISKTAIGLFAVVTTPYAIKFMWAPLVDQLHLPFVTKLLGRRRGWMIFTQILLMASIVGLGMTDPAIDAEMTAIMALLVAISSASQDIVIDAYRVEVLKEEQQGAGAAMVVFGYRIGMLISGAGALFLASYTSWFVTYAVMAIFILVGTITVMIAGEPEGVIEDKDGSPDISGWFGRAVINPFTNFMQHPSWFLILAFVVMYKFGDAFAGIMTNPFMIEIGFSKIEIATIVKSFGLVATLVGAFLGGSMVSRLGMIKSLWICGILQMASNLMFVAQAYIGYNTDFLALTIAFENLSGGMGTAAFVAYISSLCSISYTATQYALLSSLASVGRTWLSASSGWFVDQLSWVHFFLLSTAIAIPGLLLLLYLSKILNGKLKYQVNQ